MVLGAILGAGIGVLTGVTVILFHLHDRALIAV